MAENHHHGAHFLLFATRVLLPMGIAIAGVVAIVLGTSGRGAFLSAAGIALLGVALTVWAINWLFRLSVKSNYDRDRDEAARDYFERHGRWPDE